MAADGWMVEHVLVNLVFSNFSVSPTKLLLNQYNETIEKKYRPLYFEMKFHNRKSLTPFWRGQQPLD